MPSMSEAELLVQAARACREIATVLDGWSRGVDADRWRRMWTTRREHWDRLLLAALGACGADAPQSELGGESVTPLRLAWDLARNAGSGLGPSQRDSEQFFRIADDIEWLVRRNATQTPPTTGAAAAPTLKLPAADPPSAPARATLEALKDRAYMTTGDLEETRERSKTTIRTHLAELVRLGLAERRPNGQGFRRTAAGTAEVSRKAT